ncbi:phage portal protein [Myxococcus xanthus DZ2]|nr:phage portal protein [Myxococcus xanthus DZ2]UEO03358.1 phage portal protein [Myxococcus xanthus DZ2]
MPPPGEGGLCAARRQSLRTLLCLGRSTPRAGTLCRVLHARRTAGSCTRRADCPRPARTRRLSHSHGPTGLRGGQPVTVPADVHVAEERLQAILKAVVVGARVDEPASRPGGEDALAFSEAGALQPPYEPEALCLLVEHSNSLRQNVDAYATNIDGFGYRFEPAIDFDGDGAQEKVADAMALERLAARDAGTLPSGTPLRPTDEEVAAHAEEVRQQARVEKARLESFFDFCCFDSSFVELRRRTRHDLEVTGNAYWEVLRDGKGDIARFVYVPSYTVRLLPLDKEAVEVRERVRISAVSFDTVTTRRRLRRYIQVQGSERVYFKSFGDSRVISRLTGRAFQDVAALKVADASDGPATELIHFAIHSPRSPYGIPRWVGTLLSVLGSRQMEEVNYLYFNNKSVPPLALLVSGGRLSDASVPRIERFIEENLKGKANFHKILILEADGAGTGDGGRAKIELRPLTDAQQQDALFQQYDQRNIDKVGSAFRLPPLLRGDGRDFNRSVAEAQLRFAEDQVFQPERDEFDFLLNRKVLADMGVRFWKFRSQTTATRDPERMTEMVERLVRVGVLTPEEGRHLAGDIFHREFRKIGDDWVKRPITLTLAGIQTGVDDLKPQKDRGSLLGEAKRLLGLREELRAEEERLAQGRLALARRYLDTESVSVPRAEFDTWFSAGES